MAVRRRDVPRPVTGATDIGLAALLDALESASTTLVMVLALGRADQLAELVVQPLVAEIALLLCNPLLEPKMRLDDEFGHGILHCRWGLPIVVDQKPISRQRLIPCHNRNERYGSK